MAKRTPLAEKLDEIRTRIAEAATKAKRDPADVQLVAVTKSAAPEQIREILQLGVVDLAEGRVQQLTQRAAQVDEFIKRRAAFGDSGTPAAVRWHMVGHLQRNKVKPVLPIVSVIQSVDSLRLAEELDTLCGKANRRLPILMQVNASEEGQKSGVAVGAAVHLAEQIDSMPNVQLVGLMTMAADGADDRQLRQTFSRTREVFEEMRWHKIGGTSLRHLSMGMSNDFEPAIAEGATMVRIGTALFGGAAGDAAEDEAAA